jgi:hypothetical protein
LKAELVLPDTRNARELILPFEVQFDAIAQISNVSRANIYHRAVQIMEDLVPRERWSAQGERQLRAVLSSAGLKFSFRRPRAVLARKALFHVVGELLDAGRITLKQVSDIDQLLTFDDTLLFFIEPMKRPNEVAPIRRGEREGNEQWIERVEEIRQVLRYHLANDWTVIAEHTTLKTLEWNMPTETRRSAVCASGTTSPDTEILTKVPASKIAAYWAMDIGQDPVTTLAIQNNAFMYDTLGANWVGFNPHLARDLGWKPGTDGMLSWNDLSGEILAKTIWWTDGIQHYPPHFDDEIGEGWLVVVSAKAWEALNARFTSLSRMVSIERAFTMQDGEEQKKTREYVEAVNKD